jgi:hypothetical protein
MLAPFAMASGTLSVNPSTFSAGTVPIGKKVSMLCNFKNTGSGRLTISQATSTNSMFRLAGPRLPVTLTSGGITRCSIEFTPKTATSQSGKITLTSNGSNPSLAVSVSGLGAASGKLGASPTGINFGNVVVGGSHTGVQTLTNIGSTGLTITSVTPSNSEFGRYGITLPLTLAPSASVTFRVYFAPKTTGLVKASLNVLTNSSASNLAIPITGTAIAGGSLAVSPTSASMGSVAVGSTKTMPGSLTASTASVTVNSATTNNAEFAISGITLPMTVAAGKSVAFNLVFAPKSSGSTSGTISFASSAGTKTESVSGTGTTTSSSTHDVMLKWGASSSTVAGYNVYRGTVSGGPFTKQSSSVKTTSYTDSSVKAGQTYYYVVTSISSTGKESSYSNQVKATVPSP